jgi:hypothetical protein
LNEYKITKNKVDEVKFPQFQQYNLSILNRSNSASYNFGTIISYIPARCIVSQKLPSYENNEN